MKKSIVIVIALMIGATGFSQKKKELIKQVAKLKAQNVEFQAQLNAIQKATEVNLENDLQNFSYAMGVGIGNDLKKSGLDSLSYNAFAVALKDVMGGNEKIPVAEANKQVRKTLNKFEEERNARLKEEGARFLAENAKRPEVTTTASGLQYEIITPSDGAKPKASDKVKVHYHGMLKDGKVFDSSVERGEPIDFPVNGVIKGWQEALQLMPVGSKWKLFIPQDLAYGERGAGGGEIPPYAALVFEVELLGIEAP